MCSCPVFASIMAVITDSFIFFAYTMKSCTTKFLIIIIINIIKPYGITRKLSDNKVLFIDIIIMIIVIIINIFKSCSITMNLPGIKFLIIIFMIKITIIIINAIKSCSITTTLIDNKIIIAGITILLSTTKNLFF